MTHIIGVCSWSLRAKRPSELVDRLRACELKAVQLGLDPIRRGEWNESDTAACLKDAGIIILSGMMAMQGEDYTTLQTIRMTGGVRSEQLWPANLAAAHANAEIARRLGLKLVTFHAGVLPDDPRDADHALRPAILDRVCQVANAFAQRGIGVALETGQETADTLVEALRELKQRGADVGVNFDPANMILYGMGEPVAALRKLAPLVRQIHVKDAVPTKQPGTWGTEMPAGAGAVNWREFFKVVKNELPDVNLVIEREARQERLDDIRAAHRMVRTMLANSAEPIHG